MPAHDERNLFRRESPLMQARQKVAVLSLGFAIVAFGNLLARGQALPLHIPGSHDPTHFDRQDRRVVI